jgi:hypothetical protein
MIQDIRNFTDRQFKALIGLSKQQFSHLSADFTACEQIIKEQHYNDYREFYDRNPTNGGNPILKTPSERLFFILFYLKTYPTFDVLGFVFNCSGATAHQNVYKLLPILEKTLEILKVLPKREFKSVDEFIVFTKEHKDLLIDATERIHHRKKDNQMQKQYYNGKQKTHTVKNTIISNTLKIVLFVGFTVLGATHDYKLLKTEFPPNSNWFASNTISVDLGYQGIKKDYQEEKSKSHTRKNGNLKITPTQSLLMFKKNIINQ